MELHQVRYFVTLCTTLNFTRAAEACNVTQPALTRAPRWQRRRSAALLRPELFGGGEGRGLRRGEHGGGLLGDPGALKETRVLRAP